MTQASGPFLLTRERETPVEKTLFQKGNNVCFPVATSMAKTAITALHINDISVPSRPVHPSSGSDRTDYGLWFVFLGVLGWTTPGKGRARRSLGDYGSPVVLFLDGMTKDED